jgi:hypothetical protein
MNKTGIPSWSFENVGKNLFMHHETQLQLSIQTKEDNVFNNFLFIIQTFEEMINNIFLN